MVKLYMLRRQNIQWRPYARSLIEENKWRAVRYGTEAKLIDFGVSEERPFVGLAHELVEFVEEATNIFGTQQYMKTILDIAKNGTSAHRQIEVFEKNNNDPKAVVDWLIAETMRGL